MADTTKIFSWNVNGLRAVLRKGALQNFLKEYCPDILCLQEIKCNPDQLDLFEMDALKEYTIFWNPAKKPGYSGTAILVRGDKESAKRHKLNSNLGVSELASNEGRVLTLEFSGYYLVNVYTPNSKRDLSRLKLRHDEWDPEFKEYLKELEKAKPVITCGDYNCAHEEIDLARPKQNHRNAGFTDEERQGVTNLLTAGFTDTFRFLHPNTERYTWWSHWGKARENNIGWRIDYFFISEAMKKSLKDAEIYESVTGSDHCPISISMETK
ncbi:exodeoxyribonuclease III [Candidatus Saccharibacteria bacterium]|nr:exodeoxyribonuclease III [Candidatus Saccharibacteria bacterium]